MSTPVRRHARPPGLHRRGTLDFVNKIGRGGAADEPVLREGKVTAISVFDRGGAVPRPSVAAGQIGEL